MKIKYPRAAAIAVAKELCDVLSPVCERLIVAGSLRRLKPSVGDVEILFVPRFETRCYDLIESRPFNLTEQAIAGLLCGGILDKRKSSNGTVAWGQKNKLAVHVESGIPVDLFSAGNENWWNYLVCRTGPAESNMRICNAAIAKGWKWTPYGPGFTKAGGGLSPGETYAVSSERDVFDFVGLPYLEPSQRH